MGRTQYCDRPHDPLGYAARSILMHCPLLFIQGNDHRQTFYLARGERFLKIHVRMFGHDAVDRRQIPRQIVQQLPSHFPDRLAGLSPSLGKRVVLPKRLLPVGSGLFSVGQSALVQCVDDLLRAYARLVQKGCVRGVPDVLRRTRRVQDHRPFVCGRYLCRPAFGRGFFVGLFGTAVSVAAAAFASAARIVIVPGILRLRPPDHAVIDPCKHLPADPVPEPRQHARVERRSIAELP